MNAPILPLDDLKGPKLSGLKLLPQLTLPRHHDHRALGSLKVQAADQQMSPTRQPSGPWLWPGRDPRRATPHPGRGSRVDRSTQSGPGLRFSAPRVEQLVEVLVGSPRGGTWKVGARHEEVGWGGCGWLWVAPDGPAKMNRIDHQAGQSTSEVGSRY